MVAPPAVDEVQVEVFHLDDAARRLPFLAVTDEERGRAASFRQPRDALRFLVARGLLRDALARRLDVAPRALAFGRACPACGSREHGKPFLAQPRDAGWLRFNVAHAHDLVALAFAREREVGVDVERVDAEAAASLRHQALSQAERALLDAAPPEAQPGLFFRMWTRKEAYLKMEGHGLAVPLPDVDVSRVPPEGGAFTRLLDARGAPARILPLALPDGYAGAVAVEGAHAWLR